MDTTNKEITAISLFTGFGGLEFGIRRVLPNIRVIAYVERESYAVELLGKKIESGFLDEAPIWTDVTTFPAEEFRGKVHLVLAGYPCQDFSSAGKRKGLGGSRGQMWGYTRSIVSRCNAPAFFGENVEGHLSLGFDSVVSDLAEDGYRVEAGLYSASEVGAPHQRKRIFSLGIRSDIRDWGILKGNQGWLELENPDGDGSGSEGGDALYEGWRTSEAGGESLQENAERGNGPSEPNPQSASEDAISEKLGDSSSDGCEDGSSKPGAEDQVGSGEEGGMLEFEGASTLPEREGSVDGEPDGDIRLGCDGGGIGTAGYVADDESKRRRSGENDSGSDSGGIPNDEIEIRRGLRGEVGGSGAGDGTMADSSSGGLIGQGGTGPLGGATGQKEGGNGDKSSSTIGNSPSTRGEEEFDWGFELARQWDEEDLTCPSHDHGLEWEKGKHKWWPIRWPARPGQLQHEWEAERTIVVNSTVSRLQRSERESAEGGSDGPSEGSGECTVESNVGGKHNAVTRGLHKYRVDRLRLCGNGVLWLTAAKAFSELSEKHEKYIKEKEDGLDNGGEDSAEHEKSSTKGDIRASA